MVLHPASCIMHYASCIMRNASCILHHASFIMRHATSKQGRRLKFGMLTVLTNIRSTILPKNFVPKICWTQKLFGPEIFFGYKSFFGAKYFLTFISWTKLFETLLFFTQSFFGSNTFMPKVFWTWVVLHNHICNGF